MSSEIAVCQWLLITLSSQYPAEVSLKTRDDRVSASLLLWSRPVPAKPKDLTYLRILRSDCTREEQFVLFLSGGQRLGQCCDQDSETLRTTLACGANRVPHICNHLTSLFFNISAVFITHLFKQYYKQESKWSWNHQELRTYLQFWQNNWSLKYGSGRF